MAGAGPDGAADAARRAGVADAVEWLGEAPLETALFSDFDGTLSPIVSRPEAARPLPGAKEALGRLVGRLRVVCVVSGRPVSWLAPQLGLTVKLETGPRPGPARGEPPGSTGTTPQPQRGVEVYGLHGVEHLKDGEIEVAEDALAWREAAARAAEAARRATIEGLEVEDKDYGVTLHWRNAPHPAAVEERALRLAGELAKGEGFETRPGKASVELIAPLGIDKGTVVRRLSREAGARRLAFIGDDISDLPAFGAVDELVATGSAGLKIAVAGSEPPPEVLGRADLVLATPEDAVAVLAELNRRLDEEGHSGDRAPGKGGG